MARLFGEPMKAAFGQTVIVENRPGASAMIAANAVAKSPPDGLTLLMAASGEVAINQHLHKEKMTYDPLRELAAVALVGIVPCVVVVAAATPVKNARRADRLCARQPRQALVLLLRHRQSAAARRRTDEPHGGHRRAACALSRLGAGGDRCRDRRRHHELHQPRGRAAADAGRQAARGRGHVARAHAAAARRARRSPRRRRS